MPEEWVVMTTPPSGATSETGAANKAWAADETRTTDEAGTASEARAHRPRAEPAAADPANRPVNSATKTTAAEATAMTAKATAREPTAVASATAKATTAAASLRRSSNQRRADHCRDGETSQLFVTHDRTPATPHPTVSRAGFDWFRRRRIKFRSPESPRSTMRAAGHSPALISKKNCVAPRAAAAHRCSVANALGARGVVGGLAGVPIGQPDGKLGPAAAPWIVDAVRPDFARSARELDERVIGPRRRRGGESQRQHGGGKSQGFQRHHGQNPPWETLSDALTTTNRRLFQCDPRLSFVQLAAGGHIAQAAQNACGPRGSMTHSPRVHLGLTRIRAIGWGRGPL